MNKPDGAAAVRGQDAATQDSTATAPTRELVGWALDSPLRSGDQLSGDVARRVLAVALGVEEQKLARLDPESLQTALARLRALVDYCAHLAAEAMTDDLTGAMRRGGGIATLQREIDRARRTGSTGIVVVFLDVDGLKAINDNEGHAAGDELLRTVVTAIRERIRSYDIVFRYGGDEFVCVLVGVTPRQAERTINEIRRKLGTRTEGRTFSYGMAQVAEDDTAQKVIARADAELYRERSAAAS